MLNYKAVHLKHNKNGIKKRYFVEKNLMKDVKDLYIGNSVERNLNIPSEMKVIQSCPAL